MYLEPLAELLVGHGANVQPGQVVGISSSPGKEELSRAIAEAAYRRGARYVDVVYFDPHVKHSRLLHAETDTLGWVPPWIGQRMLDLGELRAANISLSGPAAPGLMDDIDPLRAGKDRLPQVPEGLQVIHQGLINWTVGPGPTPAWAQRVYTHLDRAAAYDRLWEELGHVLRLDEPDPVAAWKQRSADLIGTADRLTELRLDSLQFRGSGTDLTVGLLPGSLWIAAAMTTADGIPFAPNMPSEEIFTTPDPVRTEGVVRATRPLDVAGTVITGLQARFGGGRITDISAESGAEILAGRCAVDDGASRLGEVALVDASGRIGPLGTVFYDTLLDENAASHIAVGAAYPDAVEEADRAHMNRSGIHIDFMIGAPEVVVTGITREGTEIPVLVDGIWQI
jgi:aminopeptidase